MKSPILLITIISIIHPQVQQAQTTSQIEGYLEVYHPQDTTSIYIGREAGKLTNTSFMRNNTVLGNFAGAILTTGGGNSFFGKNAGKSTTTGFQNSFYGENAGFSNTTATWNSFFGMNAGRTNESGFSNSFFGQDAGLSNTSGSRNSFFGEDAGRNNITADRNSFFGENAGFSNITGANNSFLGNDAGFNNLGSNNSFFGQASGIENTSGVGNSFFGMAAGRENTVGDHNSFFGKEAGYQDETGSYNSYFGCQAGFRLMGSRNVCIGSMAGPLSGAENGSDRLYIHNDSTNSPLIYGEFDTDLLQINGTLTMGNTNYFMDNDDGVIRSSTAVSSDLFLVSNDAFIVELDDDNGETETGNFEVWNGEDNVLLKMLEGGQFEVWDGAATNNRTLLLQPDGDLIIDGIMTVGTMAVAGSDHVCRNPSTGELTFCSSSIRYKEKVEEYRSDLNLINQLRPVSFQWKEAGTKDLGLIAEEVAEIEPLLVTHNNQGDIEGVKYDLITIALINGMKEQQKTIESLLEQQEVLLIRLEKQQEDIDRMATVIAGNTNRSKTIE